MRFFSDRLEREKEGTEIQLAEGLNEKLVQIGLTESQLAEGLNELVRADLMPMLHASILDDLHVNHHFHAQSNREAFCQSLTVETNNNLFSALCANTTVRSARQTAALTQEVTALNTKVSLAYFASVFNTLSKAQIKRIVGLMEELCRRALCAGMVHEIASCARSSYEPN